MSKWQWILRQFGRRLWVRATLIGLLGVAAAILATIAERFLPWQLHYDISADAVDSILSVIASSMLAVTTFSLSVMTSAYNAAASTVTPRAKRLLVQDRVTQNVLSTFIGAFLFGIVGLVVLKTGAYGPQGRVVLFIVTVGVIVLVVAALMGWIDHLTTFGGVGDTTERVENAAHDALVARLDLPYLGGVPAAADDPELPLAVLATQTGYVQHIDLPAISGCTEALDVDAQVCAVPGAFVYEGTALARLGRPVPDPDTEDAADTALEEVRAAFTIGRERSYDQDPRFGLAVLSEIAQRALSPAVNDPGTAIDVIGRCTRLLTLWANRTTTDALPEPRHPRVRVPLLTAADLFDDAFRLIARDGAALVEVQLRLQKALRALAHMGDTAFQAAARRQADLALQRSEEAMAQDADRERVREVAGRW